jgi:hypothetical protein
MITSPSGPQKSATPNSPNRTQSAKPAHSKQTHFCACSSPAPQPHHHPAALQNPNCPNEPNRTPKSQFFNKFSPQREPDFPPSAWHLPKTENVGRVTTTHRYTLKSRANRVRTDLSLGGQAGEEGVDYLNAGVSVEGRRHPARDEDPEAGFRSGRFPRNVRNAFEVAPSDAFFEFAGEAGQLALVAAVCRDGSRNDVEHKQNPSASTITRTSPHWNWSCGVTGGRICGYCDRFHGGDCAIARRALRWHFFRCTPLPNVSKLFPSVLLVCNAAAAVCYALAGDYRRSIYWAASALCIGAITF